jgi:hypothetical protein
MPLPPQPTISLFQKKKPDLFSNTKNMSNIPNQIILSKKHNFSLKMQNENQYKLGIGFGSKSNSSWRLVTSSDSHSEVKLSSN